MLAPTTGTDILSPEVEIFMNIVAKRTLSSFWKKHPRAEQPLKTWYSIARRADWDKPSDIRAVFNQADVINGNVVVFNICENRYRLVVKFNFAARVGFVKFLGSHKDYDNLDIRKL